jgi:hypothetical protein
LAELIQAPKAWRVAALVSTAQLLPKNLGLLTAANFAAESARDYYGNWQKPEDYLRRLGALAAAAVTANSELFVQQVRDQVLDLLARTDAGALIATPREAAGGAH